MNLRICLLISFTAVGMPLDCVLAQSQSAPEANIHKSYLTLSAFECSVVAPTELETERLFTIGLNSGREFIAFLNARSTTPEVKKLLVEKIAWIWGAYWGPTPDFTLGHAYAEQVREVYKHFDTDNEVWKLKKEKLYRDKNCALLGK